MFKRPLLVLAALALLCGSQAHAQGSPANAGALWGQDTGTGLPCVIAPFGGSTTCKLPSNATSSPTYFTTIPIHSSPITVTSTATAVVTAVAARGQLSVQNEGAVDMRCAAVNTVTFAGGGSTTGGVLIKASGGAYTWIGYVGALYCIVSSTSGTADVSETIP